MTEFGCSKFDILVQVAIEQLEQLEKTQTHWKKLFSKERNKNFLIEHGNAWTYSENAKLWRAYEEWERNIDQVKEWKEQQRDDNSFANYAHQKYFFAERTLVSVRKHFFKLKRQNFSLDSSAVATTTATTEKTTAPTFGSNEIEFSSDESDDDCKKIVEERVKLFFRAPKTMVSTIRTVSDATTPESRAFLQLSKNARQRRKRKHSEMVLLCSGGGSSGNEEGETAKPASSEMIYREIVNQAKYQALQT